MAQKEKPKSGETESFATRKQSLRLKTKLEEEESPTKQISAEELFKEFREVNVSQFFAKNKQYLGYVGKVKSLTTVVHELITNSLDACEEAGILPDIKVKVEQMGEKDDEHYKVTVEDNGPGIPEANVEKVFGQLLAGTKFHRNIQLRGQQGIGASGAVLFSQMTTGKPTYVKSGTGKGKIVEIHVMLDTKAGNPKILDKKIQSGEWRGTLVSAEFKGVQHTKGQKGAFEYARWTAAANPHAKIKYRDPEGEIVFERVIREIPPRPIETKPHPSGVGTHDLLELAHHSTAHKVSSFLVNELTRVSADKVAEIQKLVNFDLGISPKKIEWAQAEQLVSAFKKIKWMAPPAMGLIPIGEKTIEKALKNLLQPEFVMARTREPRVYKGGIPFLVEVAIAYGGNAGRETPEGRKVELMRFANRAPLLFDAGACVTTEAMNSIEWKRYHVQDLENEPITIFINLISTHVPYISAGKQSIAEEDEIFEEIRFALMQILRDLQIFLGGKRRAAEREEKKRIFEKYIPETAKALSKLTGEKEETLIKKLEKLVFDRFGKDFSKEPEEEKEEVEEGETSEE